MANSSTAAAAAYPLLVQRYGVGGVGSSTPSSSSSSTATRVFSLPAMKLLDVNLPEEMTMMRGSSGGNTFLETPQGLVLVLMSSPPAETFLLDPRDGSRVAALPPLDEGELPAHRRCVLSDRSPEPGCGVLVFDLESPALLFCRVGGERWSRHGYDIGCYDLPEEYCPVPKRKHFFDVAGVGGRFYFTENNGELGTLDFTGGEVAVGAIAIPVLDYFPTDQVMYSSLTFLVESCGDLFLVAIAFEGYSIGGPYDVHVFRMDFSAAPAWRRTTDIGDRAFVVGGDNFCGASCSASGCGVKANHIYWLNDFSEDEKRNLYVFSVEDRSVETVDTFEPLPGAPRQTPFWLV
uniref:KIB1-4 beta-propeller domain-containing protein n=1 Tax=Oryza punctata TaxID=4537 RepID=A0A0E0M0Q4_ORYPU